ncbi:DUF397 domain-containing protein [Actinokineospora spheciospongiae]|uniref:DUF397 domain-containing protein n=1 Tax=Actinokineospora spheciospongiae TaxID=909613 RepID=UPI000D71D0FC|nr:DUF397 domain-containing protein [Actinokineospora spheciospongiae]PWW61926.1 uncharacterized protein DUF397 [Actinokineospora spheciospongiae]
MADTTWRKSSYSGGANSDCVEVALTGADTLIRDSKNPSGPRLALPAPAWRGLLAKTLAPAIST